MSGIQLFDFSVDVLQALLWQYNDAARLQSLLRQKQDWYNENQTAFWQDWYDNVFNLLTANDFGLQVWSIILDLPLIVVQAPPGSPEPAWGFEDTHKNFDNGNFFSTGNTGIALTREQARLVLRLRYFQMTTNATVPEINKILGYLFGPGLVYVLDGYDMTIEYVFTFVPDSQLSFILQKYDLLPRPAGVGYSILVLPENTFGFEGHENFSHGNFGPAGA